MNEHIIFQISDLHIETSHAEALISFKKWLYYAAEQNPSAIVITGDLAHGGGLESYIDIDVICDSIKPPVYWLPGNHDDFKIMKEVAPKRCVDTVKVGDWCLILLNTKAPDKIGGQLHNAQIEYIKSTAQSRYWGSFSHHPLVSVGTPWIDPDTVSNPHLLDDLHAHCPIAFIGCGHVHQESKLYWNDVPQYSTPSTARQFLPGAEVFSVEARASGIRRWVLSANGHFTTDVIRGNEA